MQAMDNAPKKVDRIEVREHKTLEYIKTQTDMIMSDNENNYKLILQTRNAVERLNSKIDAFINMNGRSEGREPSKYTVKSDQPPHSTLSDKPDEIYPLGVYGHDKKAFSLSVVHKITGKHVKFSVNPKSNLITWKIPREFYLHEFMSTHLLHFTGGHEFEILVQWRHNYEKDMQAKKFETESIDFELPQHLNKPIITLLFGSIKVQSWQIDFMQ